VNVAAAKAVQVDDSDSRMRIESTAYVIRETKHDRTGDLKLGGVPHDADLIGPERIPAGGELRVLNDLRNTAEYDLFAGGDQADYQSDLGGVCPEPSFAGSNVSIRRTPGSYGLP
jgi:hypothetical protein